MTIIKQETWAPYRPSLRTTIRIHQLSCKVYQWVQSADSAPPPPITGGFGQPQRHDSGLLRRGAGSSALVNQYHPLFTINYQPWLTLLIMINIIHFILTSTWAFIDHDRPLWTLWPTTFDQLCWWSDPWQLGLPSLVDHNQQVLPT